MRRRLKMQMRAAAILVVSALAAPMMAQAQGDPVARVARVSAAEGELSLAPAGANQWGRAELNRPVVAGDRLMTGGDSRAAIQFGGAELRLDDRAQLDVLSLDERRAQTQLTQGAINLRVDRLDAGDSYEIDTPMLALVASEPGEYRIEVSPDRSATTVIIYSGSATAYGRNGASRALNNRQSYTFGDPDLQQWSGAPTPAYDRFDRWCFARDERGDSRAARYVAPGVVGADELDDYGNWRPVEDYGQVWFPSVVATDWAPYRYGHWVWLNPWGWTWVDDAPWAYAPSHYGRWVYVDQRWGWVPGPPTVQPVWAPALVAFVGGNGWSIGVSSGPPVGWFPLGPREVYCPPYPVSRNYFTSVNVANTTIVNNTYIDNVYGNYNRHAPVQIQYMNRGVPGATTVVTQDVFTHSRPVPSSLLRPEPRQLATAPLTLSPGVRPTTQSRYGAPGINPALPAPSSLFRGSYVARTAPDRVAPGSQPQLSADAPRPAFRAGTDEADPRTSQLRPVPSPSRAESPSPAVRAPWSTQTRPDAGDTVRAPSPEPGLEPRPEPRSFGYGGDVRQPRIGTPPVQAPEGETRAPGRQWQTRPESPAVPADDMNRAPPVMRAPEVRRPPMQSQPQFTPQPAPQPMPRSQPTFQPPAQPSAEPPRHEAPRPMPAPQPREEFHPRPQAMPQFAPAPQGRADARPEAPHAAPGPRPGAREDGAQRRPD